jgi:hypothetical protein
MKLFIQFWVVVFLIVTVTFGVLDGAVEADKYDKCRPQLKFTSRFTKYNYAYQGSYQIGCYLFERIEN